MIGRMEEVSGYDEARDIVWIFERLDDEITDRDNKIEELNDIIEDLNKELVELEREN